MLQSRRRAKQSHKWRKPSPMFQDYRTYPCKAGASGPEKQFCLLNNLAMRLETSWLAVAGAMVVLCSGCGQSSSLTSPTGQTNMSNLVAECETLAHDGAAQGKDTWTASDPLPPAIKSLSPQVVQLRVTESPPATIVDIQTSGGFQHRGYLVVCLSKDPNFVPEKGRNWRITKVAPRVFEYRE